MHGPELTADQVRQFGLPEVAQAEEPLQVISQDQELRARYEARMQAQRDVVVWEKAHIAE